MAAEFSCQVIKITHQIYRGMFSGTHGRERQHIFIPHRIKVRTFPHISPFSAALSQYIKIGPVNHILRPVQQRLSLIVSARPAHHIISVFMFPHLRVSKTVRRNTLWSSQHRISRIFFKMNSIFAVCNTLCLLISFSLIRGPCEH